MEISQVSRWLQCAFSSSSPFPPPLLVRGEVHLRVFRCLPATTPPSRGSACAASLSALHIDGHSTAPPGLVSSCAGRHPHRGPASHTQDPRGQLAWVRHRRVLAGVFRTRLGAIALPTGRGVSGPVPCASQTVESISGLAFAVPSYILACTVFPPPPNDPVVTHVGDVAGGAGQPHCLPQG